MSDKLNELITVTESRSPISEAYRTLRTNLDFAGLDRALKTLVITSAGMSEGKSTTLANLAIVSAQAGRRSSWSTPICAARAFTRFSVWPTTPA